MSKYTTELRWPIEQFLDSVGMPHEESSWPKVYEMLGLSDYPIYDEGHRQELNDKIIRRYYFREIGFETFGQFAWHVRSHMHEVMPYFNELYRTVGLIQDPLSTKDMSFDETGNRTREFSESRTSDTTSHTDQSTSTTSSDKNVIQDTPMNGLDTGAIEAMDYATNVTFDNGSTSGEGETDVTGSTEGATSSNESEAHGLSHREHGYDRPQAETLLTYRRAILNIDLDVVESLGNLFMGLW